MVEKSPNRVYTPPMPTKRASLSERPTKRTTEPIAELPESNGWLNKRNVFFLNVWCEILAEATNQLSQQRLKEPGSDAG